MQSSSISRSEELLANLIHDLRQPLGNIETSSYLLDLVMPPDQNQARVQLLAIERQVNQAARLLSEASAALARLRAQGAERVEPLAGRQCAGPGGYPAAVYFEGEASRRERVPEDSFELTNPLTAAVT